MALATLYLTGDGVPQDYVQAMTWLLIAANQGEVTAQSMLGAFYHDGQGVPQDDARCGGVVSEGCGPG